MKNLIYIPIFISVLFSFLYTGCENADMHKSSIEDTRKITNRHVDDCDECPNMDDCCCTLTLIFGDEIMFQTCGTTDGDAATCDTETPMGCETISGKWNSTHTLSNTEPTVHFCMAEISGFLLKSLTAGTLILTLTCQTDQTNPQTIQITFTGPGSKYFEVNGDCVVTECP